MSRAIEPARDDHQQQLAAGRGDELEQARGTKARLAGGHANLEDSTAREQRSGLRVRERVFPDGRAALDEQLLALFESEFPGARPDGFERFAGQQRFLSGNEIHGQQTAGQLPGQIVGGKFQGRSMEAQIN